MRAVDTMDASDHEEVQHTMHGWLVALEQETFDRAVEDTATDAGLEITKISHLHHPRADIHIRIPDHIGGDLWRARSVLTRASRLSGWPVVGREHLTIRCRRGALLARCWPKWDV